MIVGRWGFVMVRTEFSDPETGAPLYCWAKVRPAWWWAILRLWLFAGLLWRRHEQARLSGATAWAVACVVYPVDAGGGP